MALSLFGGKKHLHHFVAEQDVAKELFALLVEAKTMYLRDVVTGISSTTVTWRIS